MKHIIQTGCESSRILLLGIAFFAIGSFGSASSIAAENPSQKIDAEARQVLASLQKTSFSHKSTIDAAQGVYETDSAGLVDYILQKAAPHHLAKIKTESKEARQVAQDYFMTFRAAPTAAPVADASDDNAAWERVPKLAEARPGDVLAWKSSTHETGADLGHVLIIDEPPKLEPRQMETKTETVRGPKGKREQKQVKVPGPDPHRMYQVVVIDCAASGHASDSRATGTGGVGRGTVWIDVDAEGEPIACHWSSPAAKPKDEPIAIGRAVSAKPKAAKNSEGSESGRN